MITNRDAIAVLCFGDSNTWGAYPDETPGRRAADDRWTGRLQLLLGDGYSIVEEGLNGRTTAFDYADRPGLNGSVYFGPCVRTHDPVGVLVIMLGTNDVKVQFRPTATQVAAALARYLDEVAALVAAEAVTAPRMILVSPAHVDANSSRFLDWTDGEFDASSARVSRELAAELAVVAHERGATFVDAATVAKVGPDGVHLDAASHVALADRLAAVIRGTRMNPGR
jgi:lysophospholipase L1-like esterase